MARLKKHEHAHKSGSDVEDKKQQAQLAKKADQIVKDIALTYGLYPALIKNGARNR